MRLPARALVRQRCDRFTEFVVEFEVRLRQTAEDDAMQVNAAPCRRPSFTINLPRAILNRIRFALCCAGAGMYIHRIFVSGARPRKYSARET